MSVDLSFWKYEKGEYLDNDEVYRRGCEGLSTEGLAELPINEIISSLKAELDGWECTKDGESLRFSKDGSGKFELLYTNSFIRALCDDMNYQDMNSIIDVMHDFACPLYDPSLPQRFDTDIEI